MWVNRLSQWGMGLLKAKVNTAQQGLSSQRIKECRKLLGFRKDYDKESTASSLQQQITNYMTQRPISLYLQRFQILDNWTKVQPLKLEVEILEHRKEMSSAESIYVSSVVGSWGGLLLSTIKDYEKKGGHEMQSFKQISVEFFDTFCQLVFLMEPEQNNLVMFLKMYQLISDRLKALKGKRKSELRFVFDGLLDLKQISTKNIEYLIFFTTLVPINHIYHERQREIYDFIHSRLPTQWQELVSKDLLLINIIKSTKNNPYPPPHLIKILTKAYKDHPRLDIRFKAFRQMLELNIIDKTSIQAPQNLKSVVEFMQLPTSLYRALAIQLYRADIWIPQFWVDYLQGQIPVQQRPANFVYHHHIIDDLLSVGRGGTQLKQLTLKLRQAVKESMGVNLPDVDSRKEQEKLFGVKFRGKDSLQSHIANSMRLSHGAQVITQVQIKYFSVDILINGRLVVQVNSDTHYTQIDGELRLNLKSTFRERMLKQWGYEYHNLKVDDYAQSSYNMLEKMDELLKLARKPEQPSSLRSD